MEGKIKKKKFDKNFTMVPNHVLKSKELSWKAKGLMCYLISLSEDWDVYKKDLANRSKDGYESMLKAWKELEENGYIETVRIKEGNLFTGYEYLIHETPVLGLFGSTDSREHENPDIIKNSSKKELLEIDTKVSNAELPASTTADKPSDMDRCRKFIVKFNEVKVVNNKMAQFKPNKSICGQLKQRLKDYSPEEILKALAMAMSDEYHIKTNYKYVTPEYILRPNIIDRFLNTWNEIKDEPKKEFGGLVH